MTIGIHITACIDLFMKIISSLCNVHLGTFNLFNQTVTNLHIGGSYHSLFGRTCFINAILSHKCKE